MAFLQVNKKRNSQPTGVVPINWDNPLSGSLLAASYPIGGSLITVGTGNFEPIATRKGDTELIVQASPGGLGTGRSIATQDAWVLHSTQAPIGTVWEYPSTEFTMVAIVTSFGASPSYSPIYGNTSINYGIWAMYHNGLSFNLNINTTTGLREIAMGDVIPLNKPTVLAVTYDGANIRSYVDGLLINTTAKTGDLVYADGTRGVSVGNYFNYSGKLSFNGLVHGCFLFGKAVNVPAYDNNFWQVLQSIRSRVYSTASGGFKPHWALKRTKQIGLR